MANTLRQRQPLRAPLYSTIMSDPRKAYFPGKMSVGEARAARFKDLDGMGRSFTKPSISRDKDLQAILDSIQNIGKSPSPDVDTPSNGVSLLDSPDEGAWSKIRELATNILDYMPSIMSEAEAAGHESYEDISIDFIKDKENYRGKVFDDFGTDRIGYGRSPDAGETTTTRAKEDKWIKSYVSDLGDFIDDVVTIDLLPNQKAALVSLVFNVGKSAFKKSKSLTALNNSDYDKFKKEAFSKSDGFVRSGKIDPNTGRKPFVEGLYKRRQDEQKLFFNY